MPLSVLASSGQRAFLVIIRIFIACFGLTPSVGFRSILGAACGTGNASQVAGPSCEWGICVL